MGPSTGFGSYVGKIIARILVESEKFSGTMPGSSSMIRVFVLAVCLGSLVIVLLGCSGTSGESPVETAKAPMVPENAPKEPTIATPGQKECAGDQEPADERFAFGAFTRGVEDDPSRIDRFAEMVGEKPSVVMLYQNWEDHKSFDRELVEAVASRGATPVVTWAPRDPLKGRQQRDYSLQKIARGEQDPFVRSWAREAAAWNEPLYLRFAHEMNSSFYPWGVGVNGNTAADYVAAWRHLHDIFEQEGADNVRWVWSPLADSPTSKDEFEQMYPGDDYVDWLALDGYNWGTEGPVLQEWRTVAEVFGPSYDRLAGISEKPMMIADVATAEAGGDEAAWIREGLLEDVPSRLPRVRAVIWFDSNKIMDWRINSTPESLKAYKEVAASCLYGGRLP